MAEPEVELLPTPCWWVDRDDPWEIRHYATRQEAVNHHVAMVRDDHGMPWSEAGAFDVVPGVVTEQPRRCWSWECPDCGARCHTYARVAGCVDECGFSFVIDAIAEDNPDQGRLFEAVDRG